MPYNNSATGSFASAPPSSTSTTLLQRLKTQDPDAWQRLVDLYGPVVFHWCQQSGLSIHNAADVVQAVWLAVLKNMDKFRRERPGDSFRGWLWTITRNEICDRADDPNPLPAGGSKARGMLEEFADKPPDSVASGPTDKQLVVRKALELTRADFEERTWQAFWRTTVDGLSSPEVAAELGMTKKAVRQAAFRVRHRIRELRAELAGLFG
jgi:RNA polymerase sigma-70 factor (ECF subfamily)